MTRAQRAMALAMIAPEKDGSGRRKSKILRFYEADDRRAMQEAVNKARLVLKYKPVIAAEVLSGMLQLDPAYKQALAARGLTQRQIADKLGVAHNTVGGWLVDFGSVPELTKEPTLPDAETLDRIAQAIKDDAKGDGPQPPRGVPPRRRRAERDRPQRHRSGRLRALRRHLSPPHE